MNPDTTKPCATCGNESTLSCAACSFTQYCSPTCRDKDLRQHLGVCEGLLQKLVERIGETLQEIFYVFSERAYNVKVSSIAKDNDAILISEAFHDLGLSRQALFEFPTYLLKDLNIRDRHAVLSVNRSEHALAYLHDFLSQMLKGTPLSRVEEAAAHMRQAPKVGVLGCADEHGNRHVKNQNRHRFLKLVASLHRNHWTLDPVGATYGIQIKTVATGSYERSHIDLQREHPTVYDFGYHKRKCWQFARIDGPVGLPYKVLFVASDYLHMGVDEWMMRSKLTMPQMLRLPDEDYAMHLRSLRSCVHGFMSQIKTGTEYNSAIQEALHA